MQGHEHYVRQILGTLRGNPASTPLICGDVRTTAGDLADSIRSAAQSMRQQGIDSTSVVGILTNPNTPPTLVLRYAANLLGATVVHIRGVNVLNPSDQLSEEAQLDILTGVRPAMVAVDEDNIERARVLCSSISARPLLAGLGDFGRDVVDLTACPADFFDLATAQESDIAVVTYTSGSTGKPKGVSWSFQLKNEMVATPLILDERPNCLVTTPLTHTSGFIADITITTGGVVVLQHGFDPAEVLRAIREYGITWLLLGTTQVYALTEYPDVKLADLSSVRELFYGGSPAVPDRLAEAAKVLGPVLTQVYGTSEVGLISMLLPSEHLEPELRATVGQPVETVKVSIRDPDDDRVLPAGELGEVCVISRWSMDRYWNEPELTARTIRDGWIHTGDIGYLDDGGYLRLHGRIGGVIKANGIKVYPETVERALLDHPAVAQAAVFGVEDVNCVERICAAVVPQKNAEIDAATLRQHVSVTLSSNHAPADVELRTSLPFDVGLAKPDKLRLRADARVRLGVVDGEWKTT